MASKIQYPFSDGNDMQAYFSPTGGEPRADEFQALCATLCDAMGFKARPRLGPGGRPIGIDVKFAGQSGYCYCICRPPEQVLELLPLDDLLRRAEGAPGVAPAEAGHPGVQDPYYDDGVVHGRGV